ncbi:uncharacterized protein LOC107981544 [Nasonia vitripennis]|uniref:Tesmin/TSO1-like CXC domain-containing protein n=1 Tax=Nasonia vitripennis TaxID=7425 RepID=A0A7M7Q9E6_NASVI|nr:uncharacterized protein LOC107981544 [Nasonia vitripennis]
MLLLYYWIKFEEKNLKELWIRVGAAAKKRFLPVHIVAKHEQTGIQLCSTLLAVHHLTGSDYTSKIGTKYSALRSSPKKFLRSVAQGISKLEIENCIEEAEKYLVQVIKKGNACLTFDELRFWMYHYGNTASILDLPPTSNSIKLHILRAFYATFEHMNLLNAECPKLDPLEFGYIQQEEHLIPIKVAVSFPPMDELVPNCNSTNCSRKTCLCRSAGLSCISFCICRSTGVCKNPYDSKDKNDNFNLNPKFYFH